ncbi:hypothetical protein ACFOHS_16255 [Jhaorihella thermophila]
MVARRDAHDRLQHPVQPQRRDVGRVGAQQRIGRGNRGQKPHQGRATALRADLGDGFVAEHDAADPVALIEDGKGGKCGAFGGRHRLHVQHRAEKNIDMR